MLILSIKRKLELAFPGAIIEVIDESANHAGHTASGAHLAVSITFAGFAGKSRLEQHQLIYNLLHEEMQQQIHVDGKLIGGCDIVVEMAQSRELKGMLNEK